MQLPSQKMKMLTVIAITIGLVGCGGSSSTTGGGGGGGTTGNDTALTGGRWVSALLKDSVASQHAVELAISSESVTEVRGTIKVIRDQASSNPITYEGSFSGSKLANWFAIDTDLVSRTTSTIHVTVNGMHDPSKEIPLSGTVVIRDSGSDLDGAYGLAATKNPIQVSGSWAGTFNLGSAQGTAEFRIWRQVGNYVAGYFSVESEDESWSTAPIGTDESLGWVLKGTVHGNRIVMQAGLAEDLRISLNLTLSGNKLEGGLLLGTEPPTQEIKGKVSLARVQ